jgi:hypothetical protein
MDNAEALKRHVFRYHPEIDVKVTYKKSVEKFIGARIICRLRQSLFLKVEKGRFDDFVEELLSWKAPFKISSINWDFPIPVDIDQTNAEKRRGYYQKKRDLALKLAVECDGIIDEEEPFSRELDQDDASCTFVFDLKKDFYAEQIPDDIMRCIKYTRLSSRDDFKYLPKFLGFNRNGMMAELRMSKLPYMLREVIGDRAIMYRKGPTIICQLLKGLLDLQERHLVFQSLQPSTIYISDDASEINFQDITAISRPGAVNPGSIHQVAPYRRDHISLPWLKHRALMEMDRFSVGIIILEILAGSDLILSATNDEL